MSSSTHGLGRVYRCKRKSSDSNALAHGSGRVRVVSAPNTFEQDERVGCGCLDRRPADCACPRLIGVRFSHVLLLVFGAYLLSGFTLVAQTSDSPTKEGPNKSWTATTDSKSNNVNPTRIIESHSQDGNRTLDKESDQIRQFDGRFEPYRDIERETLQLDATTTRTTTRRFGRDGNGTKILVQVIEEEKHTLPDGDSNVLRVTSDLDVNGALQPSRREIEETKVIGKDLEETQTTVMLPSVNGGLVPAVKVHEFRKRVMSDTVESQKTTLLLDGAGNWHVSETRQTTARQEGKNRSVEERILRPDSEGTLGEVSRVVTEEFQATSGEKSDVAETYSIDVPGTTRDGTLHVVERTTSTQRSSSTGEQITEQQVERPSPGDPDSGLRVSVLINDTVRSVPSGEQSTRTISVRDSNGSFGVVSVDTKKSDRAATIQVEQTR